MDNLVTFNLVFKAIVNCCQTDTTDNKRLAVFADVCGIPTKADPERVFDPNRCSFFFRCLLLLFPTPLKTISTLLGHKVRTPHRVNYI